MTTTPRLIRIVCKMLAAVLLIWGLGCAFVQPSFAFAQTATKSQTTVPQIAPVSAPGLNPSKTSLKPSTIPLFSLSIGDSENSDDLVPALRVVGILTILTLAPAIPLQSRSGKATDRPKPDWEALWVSLEPASQKKVRLIFL